MVYRRYNGTRSNYRLMTNRPRIRRAGQRTYRNKKLVDGKGPLSKVESMINAGVSTGRVLSSIAGSIGTIMSLINVEKKYIDVSESSPTDIGIVSAGLSYPLTLCATGTNDTSRNGNQILGKDLSLKFTLNWNSTAAVPQLVRVLVVLDKSDHAGASTLPPVSEVIEAGINNNILASVNKDFSKRFVILKNAFYQLSDQNPMISGKMFIKCPWHVFYRDTSFSYSDAAENHIYLYMISEQNAVNLADPPTATFYSRFNFVDN